MDYQVDAGTTRRQLPWGDARGRNLAGFSTPVNTEHVIFASKMLWDVRHSYHIL